MGPLYYAPLVLKLKSEWITLRLSPLYTTRLRRQGSNALRFGVLTTPPPDEQQPEEADGSSQEEDGGHDVNQFEHCFTSATAYPCVTVACAYKLLRPHPPPMAYRALGRTWGRTRCCMRGCTGCVRDKAVAWPEGALWAR